MLLKVCAILAGRILGNADFMYGGLDFATLTFNNISAALVAARTGTKGVDIKSP